MSCCEQEGVVDFKVNLGAVERGSTLEGVATQKRAQHAGLNLAGLNCGAQHSRESQQLLVPVLLKAVTGTGTSTLKINRCWYWHWYCSKAVGTGTAQKLLVLLKSCWYCAKAVGTAQKLLSCWYCSKSKAVTVAVGVGTAQKLLTPLNIKSCWYCSMVTAPLKTLSKLKRKLIILCS